MATTPSRTTPARQERDSNTGDELDLGRLTPFDLPENHVYLQCDTSNFFSGVGNGTRTSQAVPESTEDNGPRARGWNDVVARLLAAARGNAYERDILEDVPTAYEMVDLERNAGDHTRPALNTNGNTASVNRIHRRRALVGMSRSILLAYIVTALICFLFLVWLLRRGKS